MNIILMSIIAEAAGTGLGCLFTVLFGKRTDKMISGLLSFSGGVMTSIVFFELIPDAAKHAGTAVVLTGLTLGVLLVLGLNNFIDRISAGYKETKLHETYQEFYHERNVLSGANSMLKSGILMFLVIGLHNIPEGLVIGAAGTRDLNLSIRLTLIIGLHNIPEGIAISAPLISGGLSKPKSVILTLLSGVPTVLGALIGIFIGGISETAAALSFSIAGGAMLYAVFGEILPQSVNMSKDRFPTIILLVGMAVGYLLTGV